MAPKNEIYVFLYLFNVKNTSWLSRAVYRFKVLTWQAACNSIISVRKYSFNKIVTFNCDYSGSIFTFFYQKDAVLLYIKYLNCSAPDKQPTSNISHRM